MTPEEKAREIVESWENDQKQSCAKRRWPTMEICIAEALAQPEITEEEIEKAALAHRDSWQHGHKRGFINGARWCLAKMRGERS